MLVVNFSSFILFFKHFSCFFTFLWNWIESFSLLRTASRVLSRRLRGLCIIIGSGRCILWHFFTVVIQNVSKASPAFFWNGYCGTEVTFNLKKDNRVSLFICGIIVFKKMTNLPHSFSYKCHGYFGQCQNRSFCCQLASGDPREVHLWIWK